jgi:hypothetical protein
VAPSSFDVGLEDNEEDSPAELDGGKSVDLGEDAALLEPRDFIDDAAARREKKGAGGSKGVECGTLCSW